MNDDDFYLGYAPRMPRRLGRFVVVVVGALLLAAAALSYAVPALHPESANARSDFGNILEWDGLFLARPAPHLVVLRPGVSDDETLSRYFLVGRGKSGPRIDVEGLDGQYARVRGSLVYRDAQTLISVKSAERMPAPALDPIGRALSSGKLGRYTLRGEIVDSKCYFGTMRPGKTKVHRACAVRCIAGGVPPMLLVQDTQGNALPFLLVDVDGSAVNERVLDMVAEPVEITGEVERLGDVFVLRADPASYRRL